MGRRSNGLTSAYLQLLPPPEHPLPLPDHHQSRPRLRQRPSGQPRGRRPERHFGRSLQRMVSLAVLNGAFSRRQLTFQLLQLLGRLGCHCMVADKLADEWRKRNRGCFEGVGERFSRAIRSAQPRLMTDLHLRNECDLCQMIVNLSGTPFAIFPPCECVYEILCGYYIPVAEGGMKIDTCYNEEASGPPSIEIFSSAWQG